MTLYILRGVPGSGKSTLAKTLASQLPDAYHYEADFYFQRGEKYVFNPSKLPAAHEWCQVGVQTAMQEPVANIIVSNTFTTNKEIKPYTELAKRFNYAVVVLTVEGGRSPKELSERNIHNVPLSKIYDMLGRWEQFKES